MLKTLIKKQMTEIFRAYFYDSKKNQMRSKGGIILWFVFYIFLMVGILGVVFGQLALSLCGGLMQVGMTWMYFALMGLLAVFLGVFGSVFNTYASLYKSKDNDLLLSLPIPVRQIIISRLVSVYLLGVIYSAAVAVPTVIVFFVVSSFRLQKCFGCLAFFVVISLLVLILSCGLGWVVAKISNKLKNKSFVTVAVSLIGMGIYYFGYYKAQAIISDILRNAIAYGEKIKSYALPLYWFGKVGLGDIASVIGFLAVTLLVSFFVIRLIENSFLKIAIASDVVSVSKKRKDSFSAHSPTVALVFKELKRFTGSPNYMLNCGLSLIFMPIAGVALLIKGSILISSLASVIGDKAGCVPVLFCASFILIASMTDITAPSVSLEGKTLWVLQSLPIHPWVVLKSKALMQIVLTTLPTLFFSVCAVIVLPMTAAEKIFCIFLPLLFSFFTSFFGVFLGVKMPNLSWTNEIVPIKQSGSVMISIFSSWGIAGAVAGAYLLGGYALGSVPFLLIVTAVVVLALVLMIRWLKTKGATVFANL